MTKYVIATPPMKQWDLGHRLSFLGLPIFTNFGNKIVYNYKWCTDSHACGSPPLDPKKLSLSDKTIC